VSRPSRENPEVREFILRNVRAHPTDIRVMAAARFGLSRQSIFGYLRRLINNGLLAGEGQTTSRRYTLRPTVDIFETIKLTPGLSEDSIFRFHVLPKIIALPQNIIDICQYMDLPKFSIMLLTTPLANAARCGFNKHIAMWILR
jgi:hypothetical protein